jgi:hypothetical protein
MSLYNTVQYAYFLTMIGSFRHSVWKFRIIECEDADLSIITLKFKIKYYVTSAVNAEPLI